MNEAKKQLARATIKKAWDTWEEAEWAFQGNKLSSAVNRIYYAFYRACLAVLSFQAKIPTKHQAVIGEVNRIFVKDGILPKEIGRFLHSIQTMRTEADYKDKDFSKEEVEDYMNKGKTFLKELENLTQQIIDSQP